MSRGGRKIWLYRSTIPGNSSIPTTSMTASIGPSPNHPSAGPVQLGDQLVPGHDVPLVPGTGGLRFHFLVHGGRSGLLGVVALDLGGGLPLLDAPVLLLLGRLGRGLRLDLGGLRGAALLPPAASPATLLAPVRDRLQRRRGVVLALLRFLDRLRRDFVLVLLGQRGGTGIVQGGMHKLRLGRQAGAEVVGLALDFGPRVAGPALGGGPGRLGRGRLLRLRRLFRRLQPELLGQGIPAVVGVVGGHAVPCRGRDNPDIIGMARPAASRRANPAAYPTATASSLNVTTRTRGSPARGPVATWITRSPASAPNPSRTDAYTSSASGRSSRCTRTARPPAF